jgi:hypothetical protein
MLADAGKSNRKYDGAYFLLNRAGWASLDNLWPSRPATQGEFAGHTAAVMIAIGAAGATDQGYSSGRSEPLSSNDVAATTTLSSARISGWWRSR